MLQDEAKVQSEDKGCRAFEATGGSDGKESACRAGDPGLIPGLGRSQEKGMAILKPHYSILAWRIPRTEKPGGSQSTGSQRVRHD